MDGSGKELSDQTVVKNQEVDQCESGSACGSTTSMDDVESPKSVVAAAAAGEGANDLGIRGKIRFSTTRSWRTTRKVRYGVGGDYLHIQVLRVKEEESHLVEDLCEGFSAKIDLGGDEVTSGEDGVWMVSKKVISPSSPTLLPASPLGLGRRTARPRPSEVCN